MKPFPMIRPALGALILTLALATGLPRTAAADASAKHATVSLGSQGICINTPTDGEFVFGYPILLEAADKPIKPADATVEKETATMRYPNGAQVAVTINGAELTLHFTAMTAEVKGMRMEMTLPFSIKERGQWQLDGAAAKPFPAKFENDQFIFKGNPKPVKVTCPQGSTFTLVAPYGWHQLQDNRKWNTESFTYLIATELPFQPGGESYFTFKILTGAEKESTTAAAPVTTPVAAPAAAKSPLSLRLAEEGITIESGSTGSFTLGYPVLVGERWDQVRKPIEKAVSGNTATIKFDGGAKVEVTLQADTLTLTPSNIPADVKSIRQEMLIDFSFANGGAYQMGSGSETPFPAEKPAKPHLYQDHTTSFLLRSPQGTALSFAVPQYSYMQLTDCREWNWKTFNWQLSIPYNADAGPQQIKISDAAAAGAATAPKASGSAPGLAPGLSNAAPVKFSLRLADEGVAIEAGNMGQFTLNYPVLVGERWDQVRKPIEKAVSGNTATIKFDGGAKVEVVLQADTLTITPANIPADVKSIRQEMQIDFSFATGGAWKVGAAAETVFPADKPAQPHLLQGGGDSFTFHNFEGTALTLAVPAYSYLQLTDNREWGWKIFVWQVNTPYHAESGPLKLKITCNSPNVSPAASSTAAPAASPQPAKPKPLMDRFGQNTRVESVDKVNSEEELKQDIHKEAEYLASLHPPAADPFGGQAGSREKLELKQTGFFHVEKKADRWLLVDPEGNAFFHLGICAMNPSDDFTYIKGREQVYEWLPSHDGEFKSAFHPNQYWNPTSLSFHLVNSIRKYGQPYDPADYTTRMIQRARKWGFNSGGAFGSGDPQARKQASFPAVAHLPLSQWEGITPLPGVHEAFDPFDEKNRAQCDKNFAKTIAAQANDPLIIGYFLVNEPLYEDLPRAIPALGSRFACKRRLAQMLEEKYKSVAEFNRVWETTFTSFADVAVSGLPVKTRAAAADIQEFTGLFLDAYFQLVADTFHKYDKNHLLIGNRLQAGTINNEQLCRVSGKYLDVISFNYYTYCVDKEFLNRIHKWTGDRPMILSEFYYSSPKDSGLPGGAKDVSSQLERGLAYRNYVEQAASLGYIVGIEWFTLIDQSLTGRFFDKFNGENANTGLIAVTDRPWKITLAEMMKTNYDIYKVASGERGPFAFDDPRFTSSGVGHKVAKIARATGPIQINGQSQNWPGTPAEIISSSRLVQGSEAGGLEASFKLCWDDANLYLLAHVADSTPMKNDRKDDMLWSGDGLELFIGYEQVDQAGPLLFSDRQILLGATRRGQCHFAKAATQPGCEMIVTADVDGKGYTLEAAIPFKALGFAPKEGQQILFDLAVDDSTDGKARLRQLVWNGTARNSGDRSGWARAEFSK